jgi:hypothetical protein
MKTAYARNFATGRDDRANGHKMTLPDTLTEQHAFRGYVDGWSGREFNEPKGMKVKHTFKNHAENALVGTMVSVMNSLSNKNKHL